MGASLTNPRDYSQRISKRNAPEIQELCRRAPLTAKGRGGRVRVAAASGLSRVEHDGGLRYNRAGMLDMFLGCLKWAAVGFIVAFALMKLFEASHIHDDIPKPAFKIRQTKRATFVLSTFAAMLSALVWLLVQKLD